MITKLVPYVVSGHIYENSIKGISTHLQANKLSIQILLQMVVRRTSSEWMDSFWAQRLPVNTSKTQTNNITPLQSYHAFLFLPNSNSLGKLGQCYTVKPRPETRGAWTWSFFKCFWRASNWFNNNIYYNSTIYIIDNVIVLSDLVESSGYSSKTLKKGSCPYATLDEALRYEGGLKSSNDQMWFITYHAIRGWAEMFKGPNVVLFLKIVSTAVHTLLPSVLQHLDSRGIEALIGPIQLPSQMFFVHVGEQKIVRWCQIRRIWWVINPGLVINQFKATVTHNSHCNHRLVCRSIV